MALKIVISKAYDHISWRYLEAVMIRMGSDPQFIGMIMLCITIVQYLIVVNGELVSPIYPGQGLRQGDPLSPYSYFVLRDYPRYYIR